jgi:hypothetical protein
MRSRSLPLTRLRREVRGRASGRAGGDARTPASGAHRHACDAHSLPTPGFAPSRLRVQRPRRIRSVSASDGLTSTGPGILLLRLPLQRLRRRVRSDEARGSRRELGRIASFRPGSLPRHAPSRDRVHSLPRLLHRASLAVGTRLSVCGPARHSVRRVWCTSSRSSSSLCTTGVTSHRSKPARRARSRVDCSMAGVSAMSRWDSCPA